MDAHPVDWVYIDANPAFERQTGAGGVVGKSVREAIPGTLEQHPELLEIYGRVAGGGEPEEFGIDFKPLGRWLHVSVFGSAGDHFVAVFQDVTRRKMAELEAALFSSAVENVSVGIAVVDADACVWLVREGGFVFA